MVTLFDVFIAWVVPSSVAIDNDFLQPHTNFLLPSCPLAIFNFFSLACFFSPLLPHRTLPIDRGFLSLLQDRARACVVSVLCCRFLPKSVPFFFFLRVALNLQR